MPYYEIIIDAKSENISWNTNSNLVKPVEDNISLCFGSIGFLNWQARKYFANMIRENFFRMFYAWKELQFDIGDQTTPGYAMTPETPFFGGNIFDANTGQWYDSRKIFVTQNMNTWIGNYGIGLGLGPDYVSPRFGHEESVHVKNKMTKVLNFLKDNLELIV